MNIRCKVNNEGEQSKPFKLALSIEQSIGEGTEFPRIEDIKSEFGQSIVEPLLYNLVLRAGSQPRKAGKFHPTKHVNDILLRPRTYGLPFTNDNISSKVISSHDWGEDIGITVAGATVVNGFVGKLFGKAYETAADAMTDWNTILLKETIRYVVKKKEIGTISLDDMISGLSNLETKLESRYVKDQKYALKRVNASVKMFTRSELYKGIRKHNKKIIESVVEHVQDSVVHSKNNLYGEHKIEKKVREKVRHLIEKLTAEDVERIAEEDWQQEGYSALFFEQQSKVLHAMRKIGYSDYVHGIFYLDESAVSRGNGISRDRLIRIKINDRTDNTRMPPGDSRRDIGLNYKKTYIIRDAAREMIQREKKNKLLEAQTDFLDSMLIYRILADYGKNAHEADSGYRPLIRWLEHQFFEAYDRFGAGFMQGFRDKIENDPFRSLAIPQHAAENLMRVYDGLIKLDFHGIGMR